jgi:HNH endonuclease
VTSWGGGGVEEGVKMEELAGREKISENLRWSVLKRDHYKCRYCGKDSGPFHMDHVYPVIKGGETSYRNLVTACDKCNMKKHDAVGMWPMPIGYFDSPNTFTPNFKLGMVTLAGVLMIVNASYFSDEGFLTVAVIMYTFGLMSSLYGAIKIMGLRNNEI